MRKLILLVLAMTAAVGLVGCSNDGGDGISADVKKELGDTNAKAKAVDGDFDKLDEATKAKILEMANGNEAQAKKLAYLMAHPPNEGQGGPPGGPPTTPGNK